MKKNLKLIVLTIVVCAVSALNVKVMLNTEHAGDMAMMTLTAISDGGWGNGEWGIVGPGIGGGTDEPQSWYQRKTSRCSLQLGNGWFTSSIMMECVFCAVPSSCTPLPCGF